jgi:hypothetical protein
MKPRTGRAIVLIAFVLFVIGIFVSSYAFILFVIVLIVGAAVAASGRSVGGVQRPTSESTAYMPPPMPDTVMVKCQYCGTSQTYRANCLTCGAPLPAPQMPSSA